MLLRSVRIGLLPRRDRPMNSIWNMMRLVEVLIELLSFSSTTRPIQQPASYSKPRMPSTRRRSCRL